METKVIVKVVNRVNDFYKTNAAFIFFMSATTIFALLQVILYFTGVMAVNGHGIDWGAETDHIWSQTLLLATSIIGCYAGFIGGIMLFRGSLSFVFWQNLASTLSVITQLLASMWFGAFVGVYFVAMNVIRYYVWKHELTDKWGWSSTKILIIGMIVLFGLLISLNTVAYVWGDKMYSSSAWMKKYNYQFDATGASLNITASFLLLFKNRWAFMLYAIAKVFTIWNYADAGLIVPIVQMMLFWIMDFTGFIGWSIHAVTPEDTVVEVDFE